MKDDEINFKKTILNLIVMEFIGSELLLKTFAAWSEKRLP